MLDYEANQPIADAILNEMCWGEQTFSLGDFVTLLDGNVIGVAPTLDDAFSCLQRSDASGNRGMVFEVGPPVLDVIRR